MPNSGYPTPDNFDGDVEYICIPIIVPNKTEFKAAIYGLYGQMANVWFWKELGTMSPETAAWLSSQGLGLTDAYGECGAAMSCEDVADCVEQQIAIDPETGTPVNQNFYNTITNTINASGFGNPNNVNPTQTKIADRQATDFNDTEVAELENCDLDVLWGGLRHGLVERLDENLQDTLQDIAAIPTIIGRNAAWLDIVPVLGDLAEAVVTSLSSVVPTLLSLFEAHSSEATLDEIACDLFSMVCAECRYPTHAEIYDYFKNFALPATPSIGEWVLETMTELLTDPVGVTAEVAYFTLMTWQLGILYLKAKFAGASGDAQILKWINLGTDFANDNWTELCDACAETYAVWSWDFSQGQGDWKITESAGVPQAVFEGGVMDSVLSGSNRVLQIELQNINPLAQIVGSRIEYEITNQNTTVMRWRQYAGSNTNALNPSISNCTDAGTGYRWSYQGTDLAPPASPMTGRRSFWIALGATGAASIIKLHKVSIEYLMPVVPYPATQTTDAEALWCP